MNKLLLWEIALLNISTILQGMLDPLEEQRAIAHYYTKKPSPLYFTRQMTKLLEMGGINLFDAVSLNKKDLVNKMLVEGVDSNQRDEQGKTPLYYAQKQSMVLLLLNNGAQSDVEASKGVTPFMWHLHKGNNKIARLLLGYTKNMNSMIRGVRGLELDELIKSSTCFYCMPILYDEQDNQSLCKRCNGLWEKAYRAVKGNKAEKLEAVLSRSFFHVDDCDYSGLTFLHIALQSRAWEVVLALIDAGAGVNNFTPQLKSPLFIALQNDAPLHVIKRLLNANADINSKNTAKKRTCLEHLVIWHEETEDLVIRHKRGLAIKLLLKKGALVSSSLMAYAFENAVLLYPLLSAQYVKQTETKPQPLSDEFKALIISS